MRLFTESKKKEETPMEAKAAKKGRSPRKRMLGKVGICMACARLAICRYPKNSQAPVMFCEEFSSGKDRPRRKEQVLEPVLMEIPAPVEGNKENFSNNYIGLCKRCDKLYACRLTKPGGGTWLCEFFEERKTTN